MSGFKLQSQNITLNKKGNTDPIYTSNYAVSLDDLPNSSGGSLLPEVTSEDDGKVLKVAEGEWQAEENRFVITLMNDGGTWTADKVAAEIEQAYNEGKTICVSSMLGDTPFTAEMVVASSFNGTLYGLMTNVALGDTTFVIAYDVISGEQWHIQSYNYNYYPEHTLVNPDLYPVQTGSITDESGPIYVKAYSETGSNTDGTMTQAAISSMDFTAMMEDSFPDKFNTVVVDENGDATQIRNVVWGLFSASIQANRAPLTMVIPSGLLSDFKAFVYQLANYGSSSAYRAGRLLLLLGWPFSLTNNTLSFSILSSASANDEVEVILSGIFECVLGSDGEVTSLSTCKYVLRATPQNASISIFDVEDITFTTVPFPS